MHTVVILNLVNSRTIQEAWQPYIRQRQAQRLLGSWHPDNITEGTLESSELAAQV